MAANNGIWKVKGPSPGPVVKNPDQLLVNLGGKGVYRSPEFVWNQTIGPTALKFLNSDTLGSDYKNHMFVGDFNLGNIYNFKLNQDRTGLEFDNPVLAASKKADSIDELQNMVFGQGFGGITDLQVGPGDGYLYVLTYGGTLYRIMPSLQHPLLCLLHLPLHHLIISLSRKLPLLLLLTLLKNHLMIMLPHLIIQNLLLNIIILLQNRHYILSLIFLQLLVWMRMRNGISYLKTWESSSFSFNLNIQ